MRLFISYASVDRDVVREIVNVLDSAGHETWLDLWLLPGQDWRQQTISAIEKSDALIYVLTPESVESEECQWEAAKAIEKRKPIIPVLLHRRTKIPDYLAPYPYIDFTAGPTPEAVARLIANIYSLLIPVPGRGRLLRSSGSAARPSEEEPEKRHSDERFAGTIAMVGLFVAALAVIFSLVSGSGFLPVEGIVVTLAGGLVLHIGPLDVFIAALLLYTLLRWRVLALLTLAAAEIAVFSHYLFIRHASPARHLLLAAAILLGYALGRTRLLLWPWFSLRTVWLRRRYELQRLAGATVEEAAGPLLTAIDEPVALAPLGLTAALQTLAADNLSLETFNAYTDNPARQEQYRYLIRTVALAQLRDAATLDDVREIIATGNPVIGEGIPLQDLLEKVQQGGMPVEQVRAYSQCLQELLKAMEEAERDRPPFWEQQIEALERISQVVFQAVDPEQVAEYWAAYRPLEEVAGQIPEPLPLPAHGDEPRQDILDALQQMSAILDMLGGIEDDLPRFPENERKWHQFILEARHINDRFLSTDYNERQSLLGREIGRLQILAGSQPPKWMVLNPDLAAIVEHINPWHTITTRIRDHLEIIRQLDMRYVTFVARELGEVLKGIDSIEDIAELEQRLVTPVIAGDSFDSMIEETVQALIAIGNDTRAALEQPQSTYYHRQNLMEAQHKSTQLRNTLRTRYVTQEPHQWAESVQNISMILDDYLKEQEELERAIYRNPYLVGKPIPPKRAALFKGRIELAQQIVDTLRSETRPTLVLNGPRRMGKTSFLLQLQNLLQGRGSFIPVFVNGQEPGTRQDDASFFYSLARAIYVQMKGQAGGRRIKRPDREEYRAYPYTTINDWMEDEIIPLLDDQILLITIDEFEKVGESIRKGAMTEKTLDYLRHAMQHGGNMSFLVCGGNTLESLGPNAASYFIGSQVIEIGYLDAAAAEELIRDPNPEVGQMPDYDDAVVSEILQLTHRQPYLIQAICSKIIDIANRDNLKRIEMPTLNSALSGIFTAYQFYFKNIWDDAGKKGREILAALAHGPAKVSPRQASGPAMRGLIQRHVVHPCDEDGLYEIEIPLVRAWVEQQV